VRATLRPYKKWLEIGAVVAFTAVALVLINRRKRRVRP